jgi:hypothetical protein
VAVLVVAVLFDAMLFVVFGAGHEEAPSTTKPRSLA